MKKPSNVKELCEYIWKLEDKYNLLDFEIERVKPWQAFRISIYYKLGYKLGIFEESIFHKNKIKQLKKLGNLIVNFFFYNPFKNLKKVDYLIFSHARSKEVDNEYIDIYTYYFIQDLLKNKKNFIEFEEPYNKQHIRKYKSYKRYLDYIILMKNIKSFFLSIKLNDFQKNVLYNLDNEIGKYIDIKNFLLKNTKHFLISYSLYKDLFQKIKPKEIYIVVGYSKPEVIKAAKDLGIKVIEFQHGIFSKYHLGYSYPNHKQKLDYFPDEFWVWNNYWKNLIKFPISEENIKIYSFKYLDELKKKYKGIKKKKNQLIVLGQDGLTDKMAKKILDNINFFDKFDIIFKLHPKEYNNNNLYQNLSKLQNIKKIKIIKEVNLYQLLAESEYQAGVFSTALYEGIEFKCKTILFNLAGIEYMDKFIKMNDNIIII